MLAKIKNAKTEQEAEKFLVENLSLLNKVGEKLSGRSDQPEHLEKTLSSWVNDLAEYLVMTINLYLGDHESYMSILRICRKERNTGNVLIAMKVFGLSLDGISRT